MALGDLLTEGVQPRHLVLPKGTVPHPEAIHNALHTKHSKRLDVPAEPSFIARQKERGRTLTSGRSREYFNSPDELH